MGNRCRHLIVFARAPRYGAVKTRLARTIGAGAARQFYETTLVRTLRVLGSDSRWQRWLAITPDHCLLHASGILSWKTMYQGSGDLAARMRRALLQPRRGPVVLIGSDIPGLKAPQIERAFRALHNHDLVFGPSTDGGFWLVGARRGPASPCRYLLHLFESVRWSSSHALEDTLLNINDARVAFVDMLEDVDDYSTYSHTSGRMLASLIQNNSGDSPR